MNEAEQISERLRQFFDSAGITQSMAAKELNSSKQYINSILCGRRGVSKAMLHKMQHHFAVSSAWLLTGEGSMIHKPKPYVDEEKEALRAKVAELEGVINELRVENKRLRERLDLMTDRLLDTYNNK